MIDIPKGYTPGEAMTDRDALVERMAWGICEKCYPPKCEYLCGECLRQASAALDIAMEEAARVVDSAICYSAGEAERKDAIAAAIRAYKSGKEVKP